MDAKTQTPTAEAPALTHRETLLVVGGVMLPVFMGSLDNTILAGALPIMGRELGEVHSLPWLITAYLIANTAITPLYGKISDIYGRRTTLTIALCLHMLGSLTCLLAPNMVVLILGRVIQGLGSGGLTSTGMVILGDVASPKDRGRYYGYFSVTYTTAGGVGPALGGFIAEHLHWKMIFWINIPLALIALGLASILLRKLPRREKRHQLDFVGASLIMTASVAFMLAISMGGVRYGWTSPPILALLAVAAIVGAGFIVRLMTAAEPLIPLSVLSHPVARGAIIANAFGWGSIVGLNIFLPMYLQTVVGMTATYAGLSVLVLSVSLNISAGVTGMLLPRLPRYKVLPIVFMTFPIAATLTLGWQAQALTFWQFELLLALTGIGFGALPPLASTVLQNSVPISQFGSAVGTMQFSRNLFCTMLVAVFGAVILAGAPVPEAAETGRQLLTNVSADGFVRVFYVAAASFTISLIAVFMIEERPLQTTHT